MKQKLFCYIGRHRDDLEFVENETCNKCAANSVKKHKSEMSRLEE